MVSLTLVEFDEHRAASPPAPILAGHHGALAGRVVTEALRE
jgi:hypothetical protein